MDEFGKANQSLKGSLYMMRLKEKKLNQVLRDEQKQR
ncbi:hypothetical protein PMIT1342_01852 [Prochlorococcus marinus str. MIT 1342]|nr:hypothetical protein PMIT1342_01852 [Prochlorococcus marinus str. MIT 1342]